MQPTPTTHQTLRPATDVPIFYTGPRVYFRLRSDLAPESPADLYCVITRTADGVQMMACTHGSLGWGPAVKSLAFYSPRQVCWIGHATEQAALAWIAEQMALAPGLTIEGIRRLVTVDDPDAA